MNYVVSSAKATRLLRLFCLPSHIDLAKSKVAYIFSVIQLQDGSEKALAPRLLFDERHEGDPGDVREIFDPMPTDFFQNIDLADFRVWALLISLLGLIFAMFTEQLQLIAKYQGALRNTVAGGYNNAMKIMVMNRLGGVLYFLFMAFAIDLGTQAETVALYTGLSAIALAMLSGIVFIRLIDDRLALLADLRIIEHAGRRVVYLSFFANIFNILGLTVPMILSAWVPEFRLTLANTGFFFNIIFTVINIFIIENHIAKLIDVKASTLKEFTRLIFLSRFAAALTTGLAIIIAQSQFS